MTVSVSKSQPVGLAWGYGPTTAWKDPEGPWTWYAYHPIGEDRLRIQGFADSAENARTCAKVSYTAGPPRERVG